MKSKKIKIIRTSTVASSLNWHLQGQLSFLNQFYEIVAVSGFDTHLEEVKTREKVKIIPVYFSRRINIYKDIVSLWRLYRTLKIEKPVIIHSITPKAGLISMLAGYLAGVPVRVHTFTGLIFPTKTGFFQFLLVQMDRILCCAATCIYPEGEGVKNDLINYNITNKPLHVIANGNVNGINTSHFNSSNFSKQQNQELRQRFGIDEEDFVFIFVGRLVGDKGINELVEAFKSISFRNNITVSGKKITASEKGLRVKLLLVGPLEFEHDFLRDETLREIESNPNIIATGFQADVRPYFAIANVFVFPSYREGFPNVVLQAGAMGVPSIVSDINGCNEIIEQGRNGIIIQPKDTQALQHAMLKLAGDKRLYNQLQSQARVTITDRYEQQFVWEALLKEYKRLLREKGI